MVDSGLPFSSIVRYVPRPPLDRYVEHFWWSRRAAPQTYREHILPSGRAQLIFALHDRTFSYTTRESRQAITWSGSLVHGPQWGHYVTGPKPAGVVVGVSFRTGSAGAILGAPASELADCHLPLSSLWGRRAEELHERLLGTEEPSEAFTLLERHLSARMEAPLLMHPALAAVLASTWVPDRVSAIQRSTGFSPRHFIALFRASVGLTPKHYFRIQRFNEVTRQLALQSDISLSNVAADLGYSDQAHLTREFRELSGVTPGHYRGRPESPLHHPGSAAVETGKNSSRPGRPTHS
jgi:AraC-like DNA-binding protein